MDLWLEGKRGLTKSGWAGCFNSASHVRERWGGTPARDIFPDEVQAWIVGVKGSRDLRLKILQALSGAFKVGIQRGIINKNPCELVRIPKGQQHVPNFLEPSEVDALASVLREQDRAQLYLTVVGFFRPGEVCALNVVDVHVRRSRIKVRSSKPGRSREVAVPKEIIDMLPLEGRDPGEPLFVGSRGSRVRLQDWRRRVFAPAVAKVGLSDSVTPHDLRHTGISWAIEAGANPKAVQAAAGHQSIKVTMDVYGHLFDRSLDDVALRMGEWLTKTRAVPVPSDKP